MFRPAERYRYQEILWGADGQRRVRDGRVGVFGLGGTGAAHAHILARAGVGFLRLVDRDVVEFADLHRGALYHETDAAAPAPKAEAAARRIAEINADVETEAVVAFVAAANVRDLTAGLDVIVDGSDNYFLRLLLNDVALMEGIPLIYQGAVGARGAALAVVPGVGPCLRCLMPGLPKGGTALTCSQVGVSPAVVAAVAAWGAALTCAVLRGAGAAVASLLTRVEDAGFAKTVAVGRDASCPACGRREFVFAEGKFAADVGRVCGGHGYEVLPRGSFGSLDDLGRRLAATHNVRRSGSLLLVDDAGVAVIIFADGRALIYGVADEEKARALYDRLIGR